MTLPEIEMLREEIDKIDSKLLQLLNERSKLALEIGEIKKKYNLPVYDPEREKKNNGKTVKRKYWSTGE